MAGVESVTVGNVTVALADVPAEKNARIPWILECDCEPMAYHCDQCDARRKARTEVENQERFEDDVRRVVKAYGWERMVRVTGGDYYSTAIGFEAAWD